MNLFFCLLCLVLPLVSVAEHLPAFFKQESAVPGRYIVKLRDGVNKTTVLRYSKVTKSALSHEWRNFNGFAGIFDAIQLNSLLLNPDVEFVEEDASTQITMFPSLPNNSDTVVVDPELLESTNRDGRWIFQRTAHWGLSRLSSWFGITTWPAPLPISSDRLPRALNFTYSYFAPTRPRPVNIFVVDSGIYLQHNEFNGRAWWGTTIRGTHLRDVLGHGTHCAAIAAGSQSGVAKTANVIAVKVIDDRGIGSVSDFISGLDYVINVAPNQRPSIVTASLAYPPSQSVDWAVLLTVSQGIHFVVAAGNDNADARTRSPAGSPGAFTVGGSTIADRRMAMSNFGPAVDVFAPGQDIVSAGITHPSSTSAMSGTSMAAPHVAGLMAYFISVYGNMLPPGMASFIIDLSRNNALSGIPPCTYNRMAYNAAVGAKGKVIDSDGKVNEGGVGLRPNEPLEDLAPECRAQQPGTGIHS